MTAGVADYGDADVVRAELDRLRAENQRLVAAVKALVEFWDGQDESGRMTAVEADELTHLESELRRAIERK